MDRQKDLEELRSKEKRGFPRWENDVYKVLDAIDDFLAQRNENTTNGAGLKQHNVEIRIGAENLEIKVGFRTYEIEKELIKRVPDFYNQFPNLYRYIEKQEKKEEFERFIA